MIARSLTIGAVLLTASALQAQWWVNNKAATVGESHARGVADITRARSQAAIDYSQARIGRAGARSLELDNRLKTTQTFYEMRRIQREEKYGTPAEKYEKKRRNQERFAAQARKGDRHDLSDGQLDLLTGKIAWPIQLMSPDYEPYRVKMDMLFEERARLGGRVSYKTYEEMQIVSDEFLAALKADIPKLGSQKYSTSKLFVKALVHQLEDNNG